MEKNILKRVASLALAVVMMFSVLVVIDPQEASASEKSIKGSGTQTITITDEELINELQSTGGIDYVYVGFKPAKTGFVTFKMTNASSVAELTTGYVALCDSKKKLISSQDFFRDDKKESSYNNVTYGVNKGTKYFLRVELDTRYAAGTSIKATFKSQSKVSTSSWKKAKSLKKNKAAKGIMIANKNNKADWYKINLTKNQQLKLIYNVKTNGDSEKGGFRFVLYDSKKKLVVKGDPYDYVSRYHLEQGTVTYYTGSKSNPKPMPKGTYYVKVENASKLSSGYYELKWK